MSDKDRAAAKSGEENMDLKKHALRAVTGVMSALIWCGIPFSANAAKSVDKTANEYTYSTNGGTDDSGAFSEDWVQVSENTWTLDLKDADGKTDGNPDVLLESSVGEDGQQEWTYTFYVEDNQKAYYVYEEMTKNGELPLKTGYTSEGSSVNTTTNEADLAIPQDPGRIKEGASNTSYTITNTKEGTTPVKEEYGSLTITKKVSNPENMKNPDEAFVFTVRLYSGRQALQDKIEGNRIFGGVAFTDGVATIALKNGESKTITGLPADLDYYVTETVPEDYEAENKEYNGTIEANKTAEAVFTNTSTYKPPVRTYTSFDLAKKVSDPARLSSETEFTFRATFENLSPFEEVTVTIPGRTEGEEAQQLTITAAEDGFATGEITLKDGQTATFGHVPVDATYQITEEASENFSPEYEITNAGDGGGIAKSTDHASIGEALSTGLETAEEGEKITITYTNTITWTQDLVLEKKSLDWLGNADDKDTSEYEFTVEFTGLPDDFVLATSEGSISAEGGRISTPIALKSGEQVTFYDLPVGTRYQVTESANKKTASYKITGLVTAADGTTSETVIAEEYASKAQTDLATKENEINANEDVTVTFVNKSAPISLPGTGGEGRVFGYTMAAVLGAAAVILIIVRRKTSV